MTTTMVTLSDSSGSTQVQARGYPTDSPYLVVTPKMWAVVMRDGETIVQTSPDLWSITHRPSGRSIGPDWNNPHELVALANRLASVGDWSDDNPMHSWADVLLDFAEAVVDEFREERGIPAKWR